MTSDQHPEDEPLDIAPEGATPGRASPSPRTLAKAARKLSRVAREVADALDRGIGFLHQLSEAFDRDGKILRTIQEDMRRGAEVLEGAGDG